MAASQSANPPAAQLEAAGRNLIIAYRSLGDRIFDPQNPRIHTSKQIRQIAKSIEVFGFNVPILINRQGKVMAGHGRVLACRLLGIENVPTICLDHLTEAQAKAFLIADNQLTINAAWDDRLLAEQLHELSKVELDFTLDVVGLEVGEIDILIEGLSPSSDGVDDPGDARPDERASVQVTKPGDVWLLGRNRVICGDAVREETYPSVMDGRRAAAVFADPPFNVVIDGYVTGFGKIHHREFAMASGEMSESEFTSFLAKTFNCLTRNTADGALHYVCMDWRHLPELLGAGGGVYGEFKNLCVWVKESGGQGSFYRSRHELVAVFKSGTAPHRNNIQLGQFGRYRTNVWEYPRVGSAASVDDANPAQHPTIKPVALVADAILDCTARNDIVLDPFLGSGTSVIAAERTGRICYGVELDPAYVDTTIRRWQEFTGKEAAHAVSGKAFDELEKEVANGVER